MDLTPVPADGALAETLYLIGRPPLKDFLRFVGKQGVAPAPEGDLVDAWQAARRVVESLQQEEAGIADNVPRTNLGPEYEPLLIELLKDPLVRAGFNTVPTEVVMVELDRMVVYQEHIDVTYADLVAGRLGSAPSDADVFRTCLPFDHPKPPVKWSRVHRDKFVYLSPSNDLRFLGPMSMGPDHIRDYPPPGNLVGVLGIAVGFGSNFLSALYAEGRLILDNGSHRAYALRRMGITHAPCIVQHIASREELELIGAPVLRANPDLYLKHARPPMLRDYFDARLHYRTKVHRRLRQITVRFQVEEDYVPAL